VPAITIPGDISVDVVGGQATLELSYDEVHALVNDTADYTVVLDLSNLSSVSEIVVPSAVIEIIGDAGMYMYVQLPGGSVLFDADALISLGQQVSSDLVLVIETPEAFQLNDDQAAYVYGAYNVFMVGLYDDGNRIDGLEGQVTITLPSEVESPAVWALDEDGNLTAVPATFNADDQTVTFAVSDFALFVIGQEVVTLPSATVPLAPFPAAPFMELAIGQYEYTQEGTPQVNDVAPFIVEETVMVPLRLIAEALGAEVEWHRATRSVTIYYEGETFTVLIDQPLPDGAGTPTIVNSRTFVPTCYIEQMLGVTITWDYEYETVNIYQLN